MEVILLERVENLGIMNVKIENSIKARKVRIKTG